MNGDHLVVGAYRALVRLYPRRVRAEYGADMVQLVRDQCADEPAWRVASRIVVDAALTLPAQHLETHMNRNPNPLVPLIYAAVAGSGLLVAIVGGTNRTALIVGACVALVAGALAAVGWRRATPLRLTRAAGNWWKLVAAGPCLVIAVIIGAGLGIDAWFVGVLVVLTAFVLTATGLLLGVFHLTSRRARSVPS